MWGKLKLWKKYRKVFEDLWKPNSVFKKWNNAFGFHAKAFANAWYNTTHDKHIPVYNRS